MTADEFRRTLDAFDGARYPLDLRAVKVLRLMLRRPEGCDAVITASSFEIRFGWYPVRHRYVLDTAPPVVSELFRRGTPGVTSGTDRVPRPVRRPADAAGLSTLHQAGAALPPAPGRLAGVPGVRSVVPS